MKNKLAIGLAIAAITGVGSSVSVAAGNVATGSVVTLGDGTGSHAGVFLGNVVSGPGAGGSFLSFCLERKETFPGYSSQLYVGGVTNATQNSALGASGIYYADDATIHPEVGHTGISDPVSKATEWIFTQFYANQLAYAGNQALANSTQAAIWYLEGELNDAMSLYDGDTVAQGFVALANAAVNGVNGWTDVGDRVRVLNLYKKDGQGNYTLHAQDQLYMTTPVPEPETYAMMLAGLGLIGFLGKRRRRNLL